MTNPLSNGILYSFGPYVLNPERLVLSVDGNVVPIPPKALKTLLMLIEHDGQVVSKQQLIEAIWPDSYVEEGNLTQNIFLLRRELGATAHGEDYIQTLTKRGYRITVPVQIIRPESQESDRAETVPCVDADADLNHRVTAALSRREKVPRLTRMLFGAFGIVMLMALACGIEWWRETPRHPVVSGFNQITHDGGVKRLHMAQLGGPEAALFSDGARVYFTEGSSDAPDRGGSLGDRERHQPRPHADRTTVAARRFRSRSEFLVAGSLDPADASPLWVVPFPAGTARRLDGITAWDAAWSPDGQR